MSQETLKQIKELFETNKISYKHLTHQTIPTSSLEAAKIRGTEHHKGAKALILQIQETKQFVQVIVSAHKRINLKELKKIMEVKRISLAHPDEVYKLTDCKIGSVPPLGILWNIPVFIDELLLQEDEIHFSAGTHEDSIDIKPKDLASINNAQIINIAKD